MSKLHVDCHGNVLDVKIEFWKERVLLPRASHKKTSLREFHFNWKKKVKRYK